jgi:hypothetical protein
MELFDKLKQEYSIAYSNLHCNHGFEDNYVLLEHVLSDSVNSPDYANLSRIPQYIQEILERRSDAHFKNIALNAEPFVKKVIEICEGNLDAIRRNPTDLGNFAHILSYLDLRATQTRQIRNIEAHLATLQTTIQFYESVKTVLLSYFQVIDKKHDALHKHYFPQLYFKEYLNTVEEDYILKQAAFVDLKVAETTYLQVLGKEVLPRGATTPAREGTIERLRQIVPERQMMLLGNAGMGKSTAMLFLAKNDAIQLLSIGSRPCATHPLPVYLRLTVTMRSVSDIVAAIARRIERTSSLVAEFLENAYLTVFLDGFNEVAERIQTHIIEPIQDFIDSFPKTRIWIASRPLAYEDVDFRQSGKGSWATRAVIPAFLLQPMHGALIQEFVIKNYRRDLSATDGTRRVAIQQLFRVIQQNASLLKILQTPIHLMEFIRLYEQDPKVPPTVQILTQRFFQWKFRREKEMDKLFNPLEFNELTQHYAWTVLEDCTELGDNPSMPEAKVRETIRSFPHKVSLTADQWLYHALNMNLLGRDRALQYQFVHQSYLEFFAQ